MFKNNFRIIFSVALLSILCFGCSGTTETNTARNNNVNQPAVSNTGLSPTPASVVNTDLPAASNNQTANINKNSRTQPAANMPTPKIGSGGDDLSLFTQIRSAFSADQELFNGVIVEIKEGNATLTGTVPSEEKKKKAEQIVRSVNGIKSLKNNVRVAP